MTPQAAMAFAASLSVGDRIRTGSMSTLGKRTECGTLCHVRGHVDGLVVARWYGPRRKQWNYKFVDPMDFQFGIYWPDDGRTEREHFEDGNP